jgi:hypothetical protein
MTIWKKLYYIKAKITFSLLEVGQIGNYAQNGQFTAKCINLGHLWQNEL